MATVIGSVGSPPCGACKFLRRKCTSDCVFAPYFSCEHGPTWFAAVHKVFGASNASKLLQHLPVHDRRHAVASIAFEAQARIKDPVYGCVAHIFSLQQQVTHLQAQLMQLKSQIPLASNLMETWSLENQWLGNCNAIVPGNQTVLSNSSNYQAHDFTTNDNPI
ncbi:LOB domain-containing protein 16 [Dionaea muscipula]